MIVPDPVEGDVKLFTVLAVRGVGHGVGVPILGGGHRIGGLVQAFQLAVFRAFLGDLVFNRVTLAVLIGDHDGGFAVFHGREGIIIVVLAVFAVVQVHCHALRTVGLLVVVLPLHLQGDGPLVGGLGLGISFVFALGAGALGAGALGAGAFSAGTFSAGTFSAGAFSAGALGAGAFSAGTFSAGALGAGALGLVLRQGVVCQPGGAQGSGGQGRAVHAPQVRRREHAAVRGGIDGGHEPEARDDTVLHLVVISHVGQEVLRQDLLHDAVEFLLAQVEAGGIHGALGAAQQLQAQAALDSLKADAAGIFHDLRQEGVGLFLHGLHALGDHIGNSLLHLSRNVGQVHVDAPGVGGPVPLGGPAARS